MTPCCNGRSGAGKTGEARDYLATVASQGMLAAFKHWEMPTKLLSHLAGDTEYVAVTSCSSSPGALSQTPVPKAA